MPDMFWEGTPPQVYDATFDQEQKAKLRALNARSCG
jgi:hypothetical protein